MNKRKLDINDIKKVALKGSKYRTVTVKYQIIIPYFKHKQYNSKSIFQVTYETVINDLLNLILSVELVKKLQNDNRQALNTYEIDKQIRLKIFDLKSISQQYPINQICSCLNIIRQDNHYFIQISRDRLMIFYKNLRSIYSDFCTSAGDKFIIDQEKINNFYTIFKNNWQQNQQKGRSTVIDKIQNKICRTLYFIGVLIENNIFNDIYQSIQKKKQENSEIGTKSQKKKNIKGAIQQVSSTYSFGSTQLFSTFSIKLNSQRSQQSYKSVGHQYSQKTQKIQNTKSRLNLFQRVEVENLKMKLQLQQQSYQQDYLEQQQVKSMCSIKKRQIDLLSNDVENILIVQAFNIQKFQDNCGRQEQFYPNNPYQYYNMNYPQNTLTPYGSLSMNSWIPPPNQQPTIIHQPMDDSTQLFQIRRSFDLYFNTSDNIKKNNRNRNIN